MWLFAFINEIVKEQMIQKKKHTVMYKIAA